MTGACKLITMSEKDIEKMKSLVADAVPLKHVARALGFSLQSFYNILARDSNTSKAYAETKLVAYKKLVSRLEKLSVKGDRRATLALIELLDRDDSLLTGSVQEEVQTVKTTIRLKVFSNES